jgi:hypothetical protein
VALHIPHSFTRRKIMAVVKKTVGTSSKAPKKNTKVDTAKVAATKITSSKIHTTTVIGPG